MRGANVAKPLRAPPPAPEGCPRRRRRNGAQPFRAAPARRPTASSASVRLVGTTSHAGESRRGEAGNRGCSAHPFRRSRNHAENRAGSAAFTRIVPKTAVPRVVSRGTLADAVSDSRRIHGSGAVARGAPLHGAWRSHPPPMSRAIRARPSCTGSSGTMSRPSARTPRHGGMAGGFRGLSNKSSAITCGAAVWPAGLPASGVQPAGTTDSSPSRARAAASARAAADVG